jgi:Sulfotransferase family
MTCARKQLHVLYIAGYTRCGSTLLGRLLGALPESVAIGEGAAHYFRPRALTDSPCGCGLCVEACPFWKCVNFSTTSHSFDSRLFQLRKFPLLEYYCRQRKAGTQNLLEMMKRLYERVAEETNAHIIVDSSKTPQHAWLLSLISGIDLSIVHLVRDPRGVVNSYRRAKGYLPQMSPLVVTAGWTGLNIACERLRDRVTHYRILRYEDFVAAPRAITAEIAASLGYVGELAPFVRDSTVELRSQHMLGGNPDKLERGTVKIEARSTELSSPTRTLVSLATAPLLWRYGYWGGKARTVPKAIVPAIPLLEVEAGSAPSKVNPRE